MLLRFSAAYQSKILIVPINWIANILYYSSDHDLLADCKYYNCEISSDELNVKFNKSIFYESVEVVSTFYI